MSVLLVEGEAQTAKQRAALVVGGRGRHQGDVHAAHPVHAVGVDLVEHDLFGETERVVAAAVELSRRQTAEVADPRKGQGDQPVDELPHPVAAQGRVRADRHALAQLELGDGLAGLRHLRLLTGDRGQILHRDLDQPRDLVDVAVGELLAERRHDLLGVAHLQAGRRGGRRRLTHAMSLPERLATRTRTVRVRPSRSISSVRWPTRVPFLVSGSTSITLLMWIGASIVSMPPVRVPRLVWPARTCLVTRCTPSTTRRSESLRTSRTRPCLPRSRPVMTTTRSPFLILAMVRAPPAPTR